MAHTVKAEFSAPCGMRVTLRLARKARPAGRLHRELDALVAEALEDIKAQKA